MDLTSSDTFWPAHDGGPPHYPALQSDIRCEVAVIGGGVTGALLADALVTAGMDVVVLDKEQPGGGSTSASTALLLYEIDIDLHELIGLIGEQPAVRAYGLCRAAIYSIDGLCRELKHDYGDDCDFLWKPGWYLASREDDAATLRREYTARRKYGFDCQFLTRGAIEEVSSLSRAGALLSPEAAQIDVYRFTHRLLQRAVQRGARVHGHSEVNSYTGHANGVSLVVALKNGGAVQVEARHVVFATGYEAQTILNRPIVNFKSTYVVASEPLASFQGWPDRCLIWETARPYLYLRSTADGRAIIGGEDDPYTGAQARDCKLPAKSAKLAERFREMFPHIAFTPARCYAGIFGETEDGLAYIGAVPEFEHGLFALGFGGNGITYSVIAAKIITDTLRGRANPDAALFRFDR